MNPFSSALLPVVLLLPWIGLQNPKPDREQEDEAVLAERRAAENREVLSELPDGEGKRILEARCESCHGLARVSAGQKSLQSWSNTLQVMIANGASLKEEEAAPLAGYLARNFGLAVNLNKASAAELARVPSVDEKLAAAIVAYREKNGIFSRIEDLIKVEGCSENLLQKIRNRITVGILPKRPE